MTLPNFLCKDRRWCPDEALMFWPATQYWSMLFENVEKRWIISFYFKQARSMYASVYSSTNQNSTAK